MSNTTSPADGVGETTEERPYRIQTLLDTDSTCVPASTCQASQLSSQQLNQKSPKPDSSSGNNETQVPWKRQAPGALPFTSDVKTIFEESIQEFLNNTNPSGNGISQYLDWFDVIHWSERPLRPDWNHLRSDDREVAYVWSTEHMYAGCPDLIGEIGGVRVIADFKTSNAPYHASFPDRGDRIGFGGFRKYTKCAQQLSAYRYALEERTGYHCDVA